MSGTGAVILGFNCHAYYNSGTYGSPTWTEILPVRDVTLAQTDDEVDVTSRQSAGFKETEPGLQDASVEFDMVYNQADTTFTALQTAYNGRTAKDMLFLDGLAATTGSQGLRATMKISKFSRKEELAGAVMTEVKVAPAKNSNAAPAWFTAP